MEQSDTTRQKIRDELRAAGLLALLETPPRHDFVPRAPTRRYKRMATALLAFLSIMALAILLASLAPQF